MDFFSSHYSALLGVFIILLGLYTLYKGEITVGVEDTDKFNRTASGLLARALAFAIVTAGIVFCFSFVFGFVVLLVTLFVGWILGASGT